MMNDLTYEERESVDQLLSFNYVQEYLQQHGKRFNQIQKRILKLINKEGKYTNLGYLLSDQNTKNVRVIAYNDNDMILIDTKCELYGSLLKQYEDILEIIERNNQCRYTYMGNHREDVWDYPLESIKHAVLNMIIHTDYEQCESNVIKIFLDHIEIKNFGGLPNGIKFDDLFIGMSVPRNKNLAHFFKHIDLTSCFGLGIGIIRDCYSNSLLFPKIRVNDSFFQVTLPNQHFGIEDEHGSSHLSLSETNKMLGVLQALKQKGQLERKEIQELLKVSSTRCAIILTHLLDKEVLATVETANGIVYTRPK